MAACTRHSTRSRKLHTLNCKQRSRVIKSGPGLFISKPAPSGVLPASRPHLPPKPPPTVPSTGDQVFTYLRWWGHFLPTTSRKAINKMSVRWPLESLSSLVAVFGRWVHLPECCVCAWNMCLTSLRDIVYTRKNAWILAQSNSLYGRYTGPTRPLEMLSLHFIDSFYSKALARRPHHGDTWPFSSLGMSMRTLKWFLEECL